MRSTTKTIVGLASLGILAASYKFGLEAPAAFASSQNGGITNALPGSGSSASNESVAPLDGGNTQGSSTTATGSNGSSTSSTGASGSGSSTSSSGSSGSSSGNTSGGSSSGSNTSGGSSSGGTTDPGTSSGSTSGGSTSGTASVTKTGDAIAYRFGTIQVEVTEVSGKITDITLLQAGATGGRSAAFSYLVDYAIQAQGSNFGNISGATYTTAAFVQSLDSALAQF